MIDRTFIEPSIAELAKRQRDERLSQFEGRSNPENAYLFAFRKIVKQGLANY